MERFLKADGRALIIAPSMPQSETTAAEIARIAGVDAADIQGSVLPFHSLTSLLTTAERQKTPLISRAFQRMILTDLFRTLIRPEDFLGKMLEAPGFAPALAESVREWKLAGVTPSLLEEGSAPAAKVLKDPAFLRKSTEFAKLFAAYEKFLIDNRLLDDEDLLALSAEALLSERVSLPFEANVVIFDGFYRFSKAQREIISAISVRNLVLGNSEGETIVSLPFEAARPLLFAAPQRTLISFQEEFRCSEMTFSTVSGDKPFPLDYLNQNLFSSPNSISKKQFESSCQTAAPTLQIFDAPNSYVEAEMVAREFVRLHRAGGWEWRDFAVILRTMGDYAPILSSVFERYGVPLGVDGPEKLSDNPLLKTILTLLQVVRFGWRRDDVISFLKSSYVAPDKLEADELRVLARSKAVRLGKEKWVEFAAALPLSMKEGPCGTTLDLMARFDSALREERLTPFEFVETMKNIVVEFGMEARIDKSEGTRKERDSIALKEGFEILSALSQMARIGLRETMSFEEFYQETLASWNGAVSMASSKENEVKVVDPFDSRQSPIRVAAVLGLMERVFPRRITEDPFFRDDERIALREVVGIELEPVRTRIDDERFLYYLAVSAPSEKLILSYPRTSQETDSLPSFYLDETRAVFSKFSPSPLATVSRTLADVAPRLSEAVNYSDTLLASCANLFDSGNEGNPEEKSWTLDEAFSALERGINDAQTHAVTAQTLRSGGLPRLPQLTDSELRTEFVARQEVHPISELETYAQCPFQYLLRYVWRINPEIEGIDSQMQSNILHNVLLRYFRTYLYELGGRSYQPDFETIQKETKQILSSLIEKATLDVSPYQILILKRKLGEALVGFALREERFARMFGMIPSLLNLTFGVAVNSNRQDPYSISDPLILSVGEEGESVKVSGTIDRLDLDDSGMKALIMDYAFGTPPEFNSVLNGSSLQMPLLMLATERLFGLTGAGAIYDSMRETGRRRFFRTEHLNVKQFQPIPLLDDPPNVKPLSREQYSEITKTAIFSAVRTAGKIATGTVEATPGDHCKSCSYRDICRTSAADGHDGE